MLVRMPSLRPPHGSVWRRDTEVGEWAAIRVATYLDRLTQESVELVHTVGNGEIDGTVAEVHRDTTLERRVHLVVKLDALGAVRRGKLRALKSRLETRGDGFVERLGACDRDDDLATVGARELEEAFNHFFRETKTAVLRESVKEVRRELISTALLLGK